MTLARAIDELVGAGFAEHFGVSGGELRSFTSGRSYRPGEVVIRAYQRLRGSRIPTTRASPTRSKRPAARAECWWMPSESTPTRG